MWNVNVISGVKSSVIQVTRSILPPPFTISDDRNPLSQDGVTHPPVTRTITPPPFPYPKSELIPVAFTLNNSGSGGGSSGTASNPVAVITIGDSTITADPNTHFSIGGQTLTPGGAVSVSGTQVSLGSDASHVVVGTSTENVSIFRPSATTTSPGGGPTGTSVSPGGGPTGTITRSGGGPTGATTPGPFPYSTSGRYYFPPQDSCDGCDDFPGVTHSSGKPSPTCKSGCGHACDPAVGLASAVAGAVPGIGGILGSIASSVAGA